MTTAELIDYYKNLLIIQYYAKPKARATIGAFVSPVIADQVVQEVSDGFDVETAFGAQLDLLGTYRGISRQVPGLDLNRQYFSMPDYGDSFIGTVPGFADYFMSNDQVTWFFLDYADVLNPSFALNDAEMRSLIKFRARTQSSNLTLAEIDDIVHEFFGAYVSVTDNENMTITYNELLTDPNHLFQICHNTNSLPKPAGVQVFVTNS